MPACSRTLRARPSRRSSLPKAGWSASSWVASHRFSTVAQSTRIDTARVAAGWLAAAAACGAPRAATRWPAAGRSCPTTSARSGFPIFVNRTPFLTAEQMFTEKVRVEFQSRGRYSVQPTEAGADGVVRGEIVGISARAGRLHRPAVGHALSLHGHGQRQVRRCHAEEDAVGEPGAELFRTNTSCPAGPALASTPRPFSSRSARPSIGCPPTLPERGLGDSRSLLTRPPQDTHA